MALKIDPQTKERIFELICKEDGCDKIGGTVTFPENHGRASDDALEAELAAALSHRCDEHHETR